MNGLIHLDVPCFSRLLRGSGMADVRANLEEASHWGCAFGDCCFALFSVCRGADASPHPPCFADRNHEQNESFLPLGCQMFHHRRNPAQLSVLYFSFPDRCIFIFTSTFVNRQLSFQLTICCVSLIQRCRSNQESCTSGNARGKEVLTQLFSAEEGQCCFTLSWSSELGARCVFSRRAS